MNSKAIVRTIGFPSNAKTFRLKRDAEDWARAATDELMRCLYVKRALAERMLHGEAMRRYRRWTTTPEGFHARKEILTAL